MSKFTFSLVFLLVCINLLQAQSPATGGTFTNTCLTTGDIGWTNPGTVNTILVFAKAASAVTLGTPTANTSTYTTASTDFSTPGTAYENDANAFLVYKSTTTGNSVSLSGLTAGTTYHFLVYNANGTTYSSALTYSGATLSAPGNVASVTPTPGNTQVSIAFANPSTCFDDMIIVGKVGSSVTGNPSGNGSAYTGGSLDFSAAPAPDFDASAKLLYKGSSSGQIVTNLTNGSSYNFKVFTRKNSTWSSGLEVTSTPVPAAATGGSFSNNCTDGMTISWTNPTPVNTILVFAKLNSAVSVGALTKNAAFYTPNTTFGSGTAFEGDAAAFCVFNSSSGNSVNLSNLQANKTYHFLIYNLAGTTYSSGLAINNTTLTTPSNVSSFTTTPGDGSIDLSWTNPSCFDEILVVARQSSAVSATVSGDGTNYTANSNFGTAGTDANLASNQFAVYKSTGNSVSVSNLTNGQTYHFKVFTRKGTTWSAGTTGSATAVDMTPPTISVLNPTDDNLSVSSLLTQVVITFNENILKSGTSGSAASKSFELYEGVNPTPVLTYDRGAAQVTVSTNQATIDISAYALKTNTNYHVLIGNKVFRDAASNDFAGISSATTWNWHTSGVTVTPPATLNVCSNSAPRTLGDIIIEESGNADFNTNGTFSLQFNPNSGFAFMSGTGLVTFEAIGVGNDITSISAISTTFNTISFTITLDGTNDKLDRIRISGLKISSDGTSSSTTLKRSGGGALILGDAISDNITHATINSGTGPAAPGSISTSPNPFKVCQGTSLSGFSVTVGTGTSNLKWYNDPALTNLIGGATNNNANPTATQLGLSSAAPGTFTVYVTQSTTCESAGTPVTFTVNPTPVADAGADGATFCSDEQITLGGSPTLQSPSIPGTYTYTWTELTGAPVVITPGVIPSTPNPQISVKNTSGSLQNLQFMVTITDANGCFGTDTKDLSIRNEISINLTSPTSTTFAPNGAAQILAANPPGGVFSGEGVVQTSSTSYSFDPAVAYQNDPTVPRSIPIFYSVTDGNGCSVVNKQITSLTLTNNLTFGTVAPQYCSNEYPIGNGIVLQADGPAETSIQARVASWNNTGRLGYFPAFNPNQSYNVGDRIQYSNEIYMANTPMAALPPLITAPPPPDAKWTLLANFMKVKWNGMIRNYYEGYYGGNTGSPTIVKLGPPTYTGPNSGFTLSRYGMRTNPNYVNCPTCSYMYPATYVEFINPDHIIEILPDYYPGGYYSIGNIVKSAGNVYRALVVGNIPAPPNATYWQNVTNSDWDNGNYFHINDGGFRSGFYHNGQYVAVNKNPTAQFTGLTSSLTNPSDFCNVNSSVVLTGNFPSAGNFTMSYNASPFGALPGIANAVPASGQATFDPGTAYTNASGSGVKTFSIKYTYDPGTKGSTAQACTGEQVQSINIYPLPTVAYTAPTPPTSSVFCYAETPVSLSASQTNVIFSGLGVTNSSGGLGTFNPNQAYLQREVELGSTRTDPQSFNIVVTYQDAIGCSNTDTRTYEVRPLPPAVFTYGSKKDFCYEELNPINLNSTNTSGRYEIFYVRQPALPDVSIVTNPTKDYSFDPSDIFDLAVANGASPLSTPTFRVVFTTNDPVKTSCTNTQVEQFTVAPVIPASIAGVQDTDVYCANEGTKVLTMNPPNGTFKINGNLQTLIGGDTYSFNQEPNGGDFQLNYVVTTGTGCTTSKTINVKLLPSPVAQFSVPAKCDGDVIDFISTNNINADQVTWDFGDETVVSGPVSTFGATTHQYAKSSFNFVKLKIEATPQGGITCADEATQYVTVGALPVSDFSFSKVCFDENTQFSSITTNGVNLATVSWDFGDGDIVPEGNSSSNIIPAHSNSGRTSGTYGNPVHKYVTDGSYDVSMVGRTPVSQGACPDNQDRTLSILKNITPTPENPYFMKSLNGENGFWVPEDKNGNSSWAFAAPTGSVINSTELSWATNPAGPYLENDQSYVNSPCFDMSGFQRPVISITEWVNTHNDDGAVLQYSTDGGANWLPVGGFIGEFSTGLNWFNAQGVASAPGGQSNVAWASANQTAWREGKHSLDFIPVSTRSQVRFRVAFASRSRNDITLDGFAFNDVKIEERNRTILVENFTNTTVSNAEANNQNFLDFKSGSSSSELVKLQYHIGLPTADEINEQNPADPNARAAFYGLTNNASLVPKGYLDGQSQGNFLANWVGSYFSLRSLVSSPLKISLTSMPTDADKFAVQVNLEATNNVTKGRVSLFIAIIEKVVGTEGFVVRKILPNASGTEIKLPLLIGDQVTVTPNPWEVSNMVDPQQLAAVAFVQDIETKDILQSVSLLNPSNLPTIVTGLEKPTAIHADQISFFPNPVDQELTVQLPVTSKENIPIKLTDQLGKIIHDVILPAGQNSKTLSTQGLAGGVYLLQIESGKGIFVRKKVMVVHNK